MMKDSCLDLMVREFLDLTANQSDWDLDRTDPVLDRMEQYTDLMASQSSALMATLSNVLWDLTEDHSVTRMETYLDLTESL
jgi:hypothetical protein